MNVNFSKNDANKNHFNIITKETLKEQVPHGTTQMPITTISFRTGPDTPYKKGFFVSRHWHPGIEMIYIKKGTYEVELNLETLTLNPGDLCFINSEELHQLQSFSTYTAHDVIIFLPEMLSFSYEDIIQTQLIKPLLSRHIALPRIISPDQEGYSDLLNAFQDLMHIKQDDFYSYAQKKLIVFHMMHLFYKYKHIQPANNLYTVIEKEQIDRYKSILSYIHEHYQEKITLDDLARIIPCNPQYLGHFFKDIAGISPIQYLIHYRIDQSKHLLKDTTQSIISIALNCGFDNVSYYIRQFKKQEGITPNMYRKNKSPA